MRAASAEETDSLRRLEIQKRIQAVKIETEIALLRAQAEDARRNLVQRARRKDGRSRFPAFWGPNYDWVPDQDHGGVLTRALQAMLVQADPYSEKIYLLPAWPATWDVDFKLHLGRRTVVSGKAEGGNGQSSEPCGSWVPHWDCGL